jgi:putative membrane protein
MKKILTVLLLSSASFIGCRGTDDKGNTDVNNDTATSKSNTDSTRGTPDANSTPATPVEVSQEAKDFVMKAASGGMLEVQLGQMAADKAKNQRVKDFGNMMVTDHSKANDELKSLAAANNITIPTGLLPQHQKHLDMMSKMSGSGFDKHYMDMMVNDHKEDIGEFQKEANSSGNDPFKAFAGKTLPVLQKHLDSAQTIHGKM